MTILLTGANGFIGSYFQRHYTSKYQFKTFSFSQHTLNELILDDVEIILHLAAIVHRPSTQEEEYMQVNVQKTFKFAQKAKKSGVKQFVFISTIAVYDPKLSCIKENSLLKPETLYGKSKLEAEKQLQSLENESFKVSIVRPPMVYGHNAPGNIHNLMNLLNKMPILPFGNIANQRSFVYVGNLCAMIDCIIQSKSYGIFLASDDSPLSTTRLIELISNVKNKKIYLLYVKGFGRFLKWFKPSLYQRLFENLEIDNTQTKQTLCFKNPYSTEEGIRLMIQGEDK